MENDQRISFIEKVIKAIIAEIKDIDQVLRENRIQFLQPYLIEKRSILRNHFDIYHECLSQRQHIKQYDINQPEYQRLNNKVSALENTISELRSQYDQFTNSRKVICAHFTVIGVCLLCQNYYNFLK
jgi:hypothetical protein